MDSAALTYKNFLSRFKSGVGSRESGGEGTHPFTSIRDILTPAPNGGHPFIRDSVRGAYAPAFYLVDYTTRSYVYVDDACFDIFGLTATEFKAEGLEAYLAKWHPADMAVTNLHIFPRNLAFLATVPPAQWNEYVFSFNYRVLNTQGRYVTVLQRSSFVPGEDGLPAGAAGLAIDISHFRTGTDIVSTIERVGDPADRSAPELIHRAVYHPEEGLPAAAGGPLISAAERPVLRLLAEGRSSKQIADALHLSVHTVHNHRKNMLHRTGCQSSAELVQRAMREGFL